ncbi:MAG: AMP-binding protein, partial [Pseudomonadales bacterium]
MTQSLTSRLHDAFSKFAERPCLRIPGADDWTYGDVNALCVRFAAVLGEAGVANGERLLVQIDKSPQAVALYLACLRTGAAYVPINTAYTPAEVEYFLNDAQPRLFVCRPDDEAVLATVANKTAHKSAHDVTVLTLGSVGDGSLMARADAATA